ncbi:hypothetical protein ENSA5_56370 [Enhygromyxa salina]|uniref:Uncharacterized protein n=2 Tax=Enhygromyxa salina TaxID=215803 RepID=A0A2S9XEI7_9BACT|nr:hypothetical protein ENSA5_56370 [Enhygromyxa salina]
MSSVLVSVVGCGDAHWDAVRWPGQGLGRPPQPVSESTETGISLRANAIEWEPEAVVVELEIENRDPAPLTVERAAILLAWNELEYPVEPPERDGPVQPPVIEVEGNQSASVRLRYHLGRALTGPGARLLLRASSRGGRAIVELPQLELPAMPAPAS